MAEPFRHHHRVTYAECTIGDHVYHSRYLDLLEAARGEFMRFFAEAVWYPTALLPSPGVRWEAVDERSANACIVDGPLALTLLFRFSEAGLDQLGSRRSAGRHGRQ